MAQKKLIFGYHPIIAALTTMPKDVKAVFLQPKERDKRFVEVESLAQQNGIAVKYLARDKIDEMFPLESHQGAVAEIVYTGEYSEDYLKVLVERYGQETFLLILDGVQDPHNLGACLRTANAAGVHAVIVPKDKACGITPVVYKVASGAVGVTPIITVTNLARTIKILKESNIWIYGADEAAEKTIYQIDLVPPIALVFGAEGSGLRRLTKDGCDLLFKIPMKGIVPNLNVSVAVGIGLFEVGRKTD